MRQKNGLHESSSHVAETVLPQNQPVLGPMEQQGLQVQRPKLQELQELGQKLPEPERMELLQELKPEPPEQARPERPGQALHRGN